MKPASDVKKPGDVLTPEQRSRCMSRIRSRDTKPEILIRRGLFARGYRYRLHDRKLPGRPDIVFPGRRALIMIHGCFWHAHGCHLSATPATRREFWENKLRENRERDSRALSALSLAGWRVLTVWECALRGKDRQDPVAVVEACERFLNRPEIRNATIAGLQSGPAGLYPEPRHVP